MILQQNKYIDKDDFLYHIAENLLKYLNSDRYLRSKITRPTLNIYKLLQKQKRVNAATLDTSFYRN